MIDWNDPAARARHIERVGPEQYERDQQAHFAASTAEVVNGYRIRPIMSARYGRVFLVDGTIYGHSEQSGAADIARGLPHGQLAASSKSAASGGAT